MFLPKISKYITMTKMKNYKILFLIFFQSAIAGPNDDDFSMKTIRILRQNIEFATKKQLSDKIEISPNKSSQNEPTNDFERLMADKKAPKFRTADSLDPININDFLQFINAFLPEEIFNQFSADKKIGLIALFSAKKLQITEPFQTHGYKYENGNHCAQAREIISKLIAEIGFQLDPDSQLGLKEIINSMDKMKTKNCPLENIKTILRLQKNFENHPQNRQNVKWLSLYNAYIALVYLARQERNFPTFGTMKFTLSDPIFAATFCYTTTLAIIGGIFAGIGFIFTYFLFPSTSYVNPAFIAEKLNFANVQIANSTQPVNLAVILRNVSGLNISNFGSTCFGSVLESQMHQLANTTLSNGALSSQSLNAAIASIADLTTKIKVEGVDPKLLPFVAQLPNIDKSCENAQQDIKKANVIANQINLYLQIQ